MALKVLGQVAPASQTLTTLYTVPTSRETVVSTIAVANRSQGEVYFRIAVRVAGAALDNKQYVAYDAPVAGRDTTYVTVGLSLAAGDVISVYAGNDQLSFNAFGSEA